MANCREVELSNGIILKIYEHDDTTDGATSRSLTGAWIWDCAIVLAHWLDLTAATKNGQQSGHLGAGFLAGKRIVELGAGTGLPGLTAAALGASEVTLTDRPGLLPGLRRNVQVNGLQEKVSVKVLEWGQDCSDLAPPVDVILMSDVVYDVASMPALCKTLLDLSDEHTLIILAYELRVGTTECFQAMRQFGLLWFKIPNEELHPQWQSEDIGIFVLRKVT